MSTIAAAVLAAIASVSPVAAQSPTPAVPAADPAATTPDVRVTDAWATFVPYVPDEDGAGCSGPYLDVHFTIANLGAAYPIEEELALTRERVPEPPEGYTLVVLSVWIDQYGTGENLAQANVPVLMSTVPGGALGPGQTTEATYRYRVPDDTTEMRFYGEVVGAHFFRTFGSAGVRFETRRPIPIWDLTTAQGLTMKSETGAGVPEADTRITVENRGGSPTPGPVFVNVNLQYTDAGSIGGWSASSPGPIAAGSSVDIFGSTSLTGDRALDRLRLMVDSHVLPLCPDGSFSDLSDGNRADDMRTLTQTGEPRPSAGS